MISKLRLISGLILFVFVLGHFINHSLGIISLRAMNDALKYTITPWRHPVGEAILILALVVHVVLALQALYARRSLRMSRNDFLQLFSGFLIPILLAGHVMGTRGINEAFGVVEGYEFTLYNLWIPSIYYGVMNTIALPVVWIHSCMGWHLWLRYKPWYPPLKPWLLAIAVLLPALALAGALSAILRVSRLSNNERWVERLFRRTEELLPTMFEFVIRTEAIIIGSVIATLLLVLVLRVVRKVIEDRKSSSRIVYRDSSLTAKHELKLQPGISLLDHIRVAELPHASVCGGRGRCSTCRVRIDSGNDMLSPAVADELKVLERIGAPANVRLACQAIPSAPVSITALLRPTANSESSLNSRSARGAEEQQIAVLFADIRGFTKLSENRLPYDTAFLLNRYFSSMGEAIEEAGGYVDKFIGDGVMALFGVNEGYEEACRKSVDAAIRMSKRLELLNQNLAEDLDEPLQIGIGIHSGTAIVGEMGYGNTVNLTAIGDVVNIASRLEALTKQYTAQFIISQETAIISGFGFSDYPTEEVEIRGRDESLLIHVVKSAVTLDKKEKELLLS